MSTPFIVPKKSSTIHNEKLQEKKCAFPGCKKSFKGTGKSRYCPEHRKRKYRKIIDAGKKEAKLAEEEIKNPNQTLKHQYTDSIIVSMKCKLEGCNNNFDIKVIPNIFVYPKFCPDHRNEYKRNLFLKIGKNNGLSSN